MTASISLTVKIENDLPEIVEGAISFETGASRSNLDGFIYEHHGKEFTSFDKGALSSFFEDLVMGRSLPLTFATPSVKDVDTLVAISLFLHRDLALHPAMSGFVANVDFVHRHGFSALAHIPEEQARFLCVLRTYLPTDTLTKREFSERLTSSITWIREYILEEKLPHLGTTSDPVRVLDTGTNGFVVAETSGVLVDGWVELYRQGFLRGLLVNATGDRRMVLAARKSHFVGMNLSLAARLLNQMELAMGELPEWRSDELWLHGPSNGTLILVNHMLEVLTRV